MPPPPIALVLHGGAGARRTRDYAVETGHMRGLVEEGRDLLAGGAGALEVVTRLVEALELSGLYIAGRGASPNQEGAFELDASVMDGARRAAGGVAALVGYKSPIRVARAVMERSPHVLLAGAGAAAFAKTQGFEPIEDPAAWFVPTGTDEANAVTELAHGTVGCVALDREGRLAGATSTGGVFNKMPGRVGDTPLPGAGTYADGHVAVSCTGQGEYFIRTAAAAEVSARIRLAGDALYAAGEAVIADIGRLGGHGGLIAVDRAGAVTAPYNSEGMKRALLHADGRIEAGAFDLS